MSRVVDGPIGCGRPYDPSRDVRLAQDMEAELSADVEYFDHPTKGRIRLRDELVHPPGSLSVEVASGDHGDVDSLDEWDPA